MARSRCFRAPPSPPPRPGLHPRAVITHPRGSWVAQARHSSGRASTDKPGRLGKKGANLHVIARQQSIQYQPRLCTPDSELALGAGINRDIWHGFEIAQVVAQQNNCCLMIVHMLSLSIRHFQFQVSQRLGLGCESVPARRRRAGLLEAVSCALAPHSCATTSQNHHLLREPVMAKDSDHIRGRYGDRSEDTQFFKRIKLILTFMI